MFAAKEIEGAQDIRSVCMSVRTQYAIINLLRLAHTVNMKKFCLKMFTTTELTFNVNLMENQRSCEFYCHTFVRR